MTVGSPSIFRRIFAACAVAGLCLSGAAASAATLVVTTEADGFASNDGCSLREAIVNANGDSKSGSSECSRGNGADTIILPPLISTKYVLRMVAGDEDDARIGDFDISSDITILGGGQQTTIVDADNTGRIFDVHGSAGKLTLRSLFLNNAYSPQDGGAIRVGASATLDATDIGINEAGTGGRGGGIYAAANSQVTLGRSAIHFNRAKAVGGAGGGIFCNDCNLSVDASTFANNEATDVGGGIYIADGSAVTLNFVTVGYNEASLGAGLFVDGGIVPVSLSLFGSLLADNGGGLPGEDIKCIAAITASETFVEYPDCALMAGSSWYTRPDLGATTGPEILQGITSQRFDGQPGKILQWSESLFEVPGGLCAAHVDQLGTAAYQNNGGAPVPDYGCDVGAFESPLFYAEKMFLPAKSAGASVPVTIWTDASNFQPTTVQLEVVAPGGTGETCDFPGATLYFDGTERTQVAYVDPDVLFTSPALDRPVRMCELRARVLAGSDPDLVGATTGIIRLIYEDVVTSQAGGLSSPSPGKYLQFGSVPIAGGSANIYFKPVVSDWNITAAAISGSDASMFAVTAGLPFALSSASVGGTNFGLRCLGGTLGDYDAILQLTTDNPSYPTLNYGLRCRVAHHLSLAVGSGSDTIAENGTVTLVASLDSDNQSSPVTFDLDLTGTATPAFDSNGDPTDDPDYTLSPAGPYTIGTGERSVQITLSSVDDEISGEDIESIVARLSLPDRNDVVVSEYAQQSIMRILENDFPDEGLDLTLSGVPEHLAPGAQLTAGIIAVNTSTESAVSGFEVKIDVDAPVQVRSYVITEILMSCEEHKAYLGRVYEDDPVKLAAKLAAVTCNDGDTVSSTDPAYTDSAGDLYRASFCSIAPDQYWARCSLGDSKSLPRGGSVRIRAVLEMALMERIPQIDYPGVVSVEANGTAALDEVHAEKSAAYVIEGQSSEQGGSFALPLMWVAVLLALRGRRKRSTGREAR